MPTYASRTQSPLDGVTVTGEAVWRVPPERAEFLIEIMSSAPSAAQALHDNQAKSEQLAQVMNSLGVQQADLQTISTNVYNLYTPVLPALQAYGGLANMGSYGTGAAPVPAEIQSARYHARNILRLNVRDPRRLGEIVDTVTRAGVAIVSPLSVGVSDEAGARKHALEAAGKDARVKAEGLAAAAGKQIDDAVGIAEDIVATNGVYTALRSALPFAFGAGAPQVVGELEYYARVSASFRLK
ncbi:MAG TPA: SIMPL domain-containing protein [Bryobacteraceae bacterium]|nr:SIMPL domain-containing protein [Bryobacteraceae bacterium]